MSDGTGTTRYTYDPAGKVLSATNGAGATVGYTYNTTGQLTALTYPDGKTVTYGYDNAGSMTTATDWSGNTTRFAYNGDGELTGQHRPERDHRDHHPRPERPDPAITVASGSGTLAAYTYGYDAAGQLTTAGDGATHTYNFDALGQLAAGYTSSPAGQLRNLPDGSTQTYNTAQQLTTRDQQPPAPPPTPTTATGSGPGPPPAPPPPPTATTRPVTSPPSPHPAGPPPATPPTATDCGRAAPKPAPPAGSSGPPPAACPCYSTTAPTATSTDPGSPPTPRSTPPAPSNTCTATTSAPSDSSPTPAGTVIGTSTYDPYGNRTGHTGTADSPIGYTGNWTDPTTGLVYLRARDYDPTTGQFLTIDPLVDATHQPYAYADNNPLQNTDPSGLCTDCNWLENFVTSPWADIAVGPVVAWLSHNPNSKVTKGASAPAQGSATRSPSAPPRRYENGSAPTARSTTTADGTEPENSPA